MAKKDFTNQENVDREKDAPKEGYEQNSQQENAEGGKTYVKNAHAAGDGAFGRNEASLPEEEENDKKTEDDPAY